MNEYVDLIHFRTHGKRGHTAGCGKASMQYLASAYDPLKKLKAKNIRYVVALQKMPMGLFCFHCLIAVRERDLAISTAVFKRLFPDRFSPKDV